MQKQTSAVSFYSHDDWVWFNINLLGKAARLFFNQVGTINRISKSSQLKTALDEQLSLSKRIFSEKKKKSPVLDLKENMHQPQGE